MNTDNNQNTNNQIDNYIDVIQEILGTGSSLLAPKPVAEMIDTVNILIDVKQEQNSSSEIPTWKMTVANLVGASASAPVFSVGEGTSIAVALTTLSIGGPAGLIGSAVILYNGSVMTAQLTNETYRLTHNEILNLLNSPGFVEKEEAVTAKITDFRDSVIDFLGKTTGWSQQPSLINKLLKNISDEAMHQATNISDLLKQSLDSLNNSAKDLSDWFKDMARSLDRAENAVPQRSDPLVLDLDGDGVKLIALDDSKVFFDLDNDGFKESVGWVSGDEFKI